MACCVWSLVRSVISLFPYVTACAVDGFVCSARSRFVVGKCVSKSRFSLAAVTVQFGTIVFIMLVRFVTYHLANCRVDLLNMSPDGVRYVCCQCWW